MDEVAGRSLRDTPDKELNHPALEIDVKVEADPMLMLMLHE